MKILRLIGRILMIPLILTIGFGGFIIIIFFEMITTFVCELWDELRALPYTLKRWIVEGEI